MVASDRERLVEKLAAIEHERWAHWQRFIHSSAKRQPDGSLLLPSGTVERWERQIAAGYDQLSPEEKESDRKQVERYLPIVEQWYSTDRSSGEN